MLVFGGVDDSKLDCQMNPPVPNPFRLADSVDELLTVMARLAGIKQTGRGAEGRGKTLDGWIDG